MKKVLFTLLLSVMFIGYNEASVIRCNTEDGIKITVTVELGTPIVCIPAFSICRVTFSGGNLVGTTELLNATDGKAGSGGGGGGGASWLISIPRDNFAKYYPEYLSKLDGRNTVVFESTYTAPAELKKALGTTSDLVVQAGVAYPLSYANGVYTITFPVK